MGPPHWIMLCISVCTSVDFTSCSVILHLSDLILWAAEGTTREVTVTFNSRVLGVLGCGVSFHILNLIFVAAEGLGGGRWGGG